MCNECLVFPLLRPGWEVRGEGRHERSKKELPFFTSPKQLYHIPKWLMLMGSFPSQKSCTRTHDDLGWWVFPARTVSIDEQFFPWSLLMTDSRQTVTPSVATPGGCCSREVHWKPQLSAQPLQQCRACGLTSVTGEIIEQAHWQKREPWSPRKLRSNPIQPRNNFQSWTNYLVSPDPLFSGIAKNKMHSSMEEA